MGTHPIPAPSISKVPDPHEQIASIVFGYWQARTLAVAAELELADVLAGGPLALEELAARTKTDPPSLFRMLRALESIGIFTQVAPGVFANTPASECLRKNIPGSSWAFVMHVLMAGGGLYEAWAGFRGSVETGQIAFDQIYGYSWWEYCKRNPYVREIFDEAMRSVTAPMTAAVTSGFDWSQFGTIADIGGGIGTQLVDILHAHPTCHGILLDQHTVIANSIPHDRMEARGGSFFDEVPAGADAYVMRMVIHDWAEAEALTILRNIRAAIRPAARLILIENVIPETPEFSIGKWLDLHMLTAAGGRERTAAEYGRLFSDAGFELERVVPTQSPLSILLAKPV